MGRAGLGDRDGCSGRRVCMAGVSVAGKVVSMTTLGRGCAERGLGRRALLEPCT
jgi:hypothetical protein